METGSQPEIAQVPGRASNFELQASKRRTHCLKQATDMKARASHPGAVYERIPRLAFRLQRFDKTCTRPGGHVPRHGNGHGHHAYRAGALVGGDDGDNVRDVGVQLIGVGRGALRGARHRGLMVVRTDRMVVMVVRVVMVWGVVVDMLRVHAGRVWGGRGMRARGGVCGGEGDGRVGAVHSGRHSARCRGRGRRLGTFLGVGVKGVLSPLTHHGGARRRIGPEAGEGRLTGDRIVPNARRRLRRWASSLPLRESSCIGCQPKRLPVSIWV